MAATLSPLRDRLLKRLKKISESSEHPVARLMSASAAVYASSISFDQFLADEELYKLYLSIIPRVITPPALV